MIVETISDALIWTEKFHRQMKSRLQEAADNLEDERARMLASYMVEHETHLIELVKEFHRQTESKLLLTWCVDYIEEHKPFELETGDSPYTKMNLEELFKAVIQEHDKLIDFYRHLNARAGTAEMTMLARNMWLMEEHEAQRIAQSINRLQDI